MTGKEIVRELINTLSAQYNIGSDLLVATMHDRAACNMFALRTLTIMFPKLADVGRFSHMLDLVGEKFTTPHLSSVMVWWISLFSHSPKSMLLWKEKTGQAYRGYSPTRWWSKFEIIKQLMELLGNLRSFLEENTSISPATRGKPLGMLQNPEEKPYLMVELAVTVDTALPFVKATYVLDGDGPLALSYYESISSLNAAARQGNYSILASVASNLSSGDTDMEEHLIDHAKSCV